MRRSVIACALTCVTIAVSGCAVGFPASIPSERRLGASVDEEEEEDAGKALEKRPTHASVDGGSTTQSSSGTTGGGTPAAQDAGIVSGNGADASVTPPVVVGECGGETTQAACGQCCDTKYQAGLTVWVQAYGNCACVSPGACANVCANSWCAGTGTTAGSACDNCLTAQDQGQCGTAAGNACNQSATCLAWDKCYADSKCSAK